MSEIKTEAENIIKRGRGRPKGSKNAPKVNVQTKTSAVNNLSNVTTSTMGNINTSVKTQTSYTPFGTQTPKADADKELKTGSKNSKAPSEKGGHPDRNRTTNKLWLYIALAVLLGLFSTPFLLSVDGRRWIRMNLEKLQTALKTQKQA